MQPVDGMSLHSSRLIRRVRLAMAVAVGIPAALAGPASAAQREQAALPQLVSAGCPVQYEALRQHPYTSEQLQEARSGRFKLSEKPFPPAQISPPVDWTRDPYDSKSWRKAFHTLSYLDALFHIYNDGTTPEGERVAALSQARDLGLDWIASNPKGGKHVDPRGWTNKVVADRGPYIAYLARAAACQGILTAAQAEILVSSVEKHARYLSQSDHYNPSNHGLFMDLGLGLLAKYLPNDARAPAWAALAKSRFLSTFGRRLSAEGVWLEHSPGYQTVSWIVVQRFIDFVAPDDAALKAVADRMVDVAGWFIMPDGYRPQFGDTELRLSRSEAQLAAADDDGMEVYPQGGFAIVKDRATNSYFAITSGFHSYKEKGFPGISHKHADDLSFELYERGQRIVSDTGVFNKDANRFRDFGRSAQAHSVLTVDKQGFDLSNKTVYGSGILAWGEGDGWYAVLARNPILKGQDVKHRRLFLYKPNVALVVVDEARSHDKHVYDRYFQIGPGIDAVEGGKKVRLSKADFLGRLTDDRTREKGRRILTRGEDDPLAGYTFPMFRQKRPRWTLDYRAKAEDLLGVATFSLDPTQPLRAIAPPGSTGMELSLRGPRIPAGVLNVTRGGKQLVVDQLP